MKQLFSLILAIGMGYFGYSQNSDYYNRMQHIFGNINKAKVTTGYLKEFGIRFNEVEAYNGSISTANWADKMQWQSLYSSLYTMRVGSAASAMVAPGTVFSTLKTQQAASTDVLLAAQFFNYQQYKADAHTNGDVTITAERIYDVAGRNPYDAKKVFAVAPLKDRLDGNTFTFRLPASMFYTNDSAPNRISIDFGDGSGYRSVLLDTPVNVTYATGGEKEIKYQFRYGTGKGIIYSSHSKIMVNYTPPTTAARFDGSGATTHFITGGAYQGASATGMVTIELAPGHTQLTKPLIVVEGFDPDNRFNYDDFFDKDDPGAINVDINPSPSVFYSLNQAIEDEGYDLVFVNYLNSTDMIQRNALMVKKVIEDVNDRKLLAGSTEKNVVMGMSMGGLVARYALRKMELENIDHQTKLYISHDVPHQGANVPLAMQAMVRHLVGEEVNLPIFFGLFDITLVELKDLLPDLRTGLNLLQSPAAQQMLIYQLQGTGSGVTVNNNSLYQSFATEYKNMGYPQMYGIRNIAIANGSECSMPLGFAPYADLVNMNVKMDLSFFVANVLLSSLYLYTGNPVSYITSLLSTNTDIKAQFNLKALPSKQVKQIYSGRIFIKKKVLFVIDVEEQLIGQKSLNSTASMLALDNASGGIYDIDKFVSLPSEMDSYVLQRKFNFIPTFSSLDISAGNAVMGVSDLSQPYSPLSPPLSPKSSPFQNFYTNPLSSENHTQFTLNNGNWLLKELKGEVGFYSCASSCPGTTPLRIFGDRQLCDNETNIYSLQNLNPNSNMTVTWSVDPSSSVSSMVPNGNTVSVTSSANLNGTAVVKATVSDSCNGQNVVEAFIYMGANRPRMLDINGDEVFNVSGGTSIHHDVVFSSPGALQWEWRKISGNYSLINISNNHATIFSYQPASGIFDVRTRDACGWGPRTMITVNITSAPGGGGFEPQFVAYPNPASDFLTIEPSVNQSINNAMMGSSFDETQNIMEVTTTESSSTLYDFNGNQVRNVSPAAGTMNLQGLPPGHYILIISNDGGTETHHILKQ